MSRRKSSPALLALVALLATLTLPPPTARAAGFDLRWDACAADGGASNRDFACDDDFAPTHVLVTSLRLDEPMATAFSADAVFDLIVANSQPVPDWWEIWFSGCRIGGMTADPTPDPAAVNCTDWAAGFEGFAGITDYNDQGSIAPGDADSHRRILVSAFANPPTGVNLAANQDYFVFKITIDNLGTVDPPACAGCSLPVCIVLNSIRLVSGEPAPAVRTLTTGTSPGSNFATWQGGAGANCQSVPAKRTTWGSVKALYR